MMNANNMENLDIEIDEELLRQFSALAVSIGMTPEYLMERFCEWCVAEDTRDAAMQWLLENRD